jgi:hypothetical protein
VYPVSRKFKVYAAYIIRTIQRTGFYGKKLSREGYSERPLEGKTIAVCTHMDPRIIQVIPVVPCAATNPLAPISDRIENPPNMKSIDAGFTLYVCSRYNMPV